MTNLIKMDLHRMFRARSFKVCLILAFSFGFIGMPLLKLFSFLLNIIPGAESSVSALMPDSTNLSSIIANPFPALNCMLLMFSACYFFYADLEHGYIKNIAGQMPKKGYSILSRYLALIPHNLIFIVTGIIGNLIGNLLIVRVVVDQDVMKMTGSLLVRFLLLQGLCAILLLVVSALHSKTFGMVLSVVFGGEMMKLIYTSIDLAIRLGFKKTVEIEKIMPDQLMWEQAPELIPALPVAAATIIVFLVLAIRIFDRRAIK